MVCSFCLPSRFPASSSLRNWAGRHSYIQATATWACHMLLGSKAASLPPPSSFSPSSPIQSTHIQCLLELFPSLAFPLSSVPCLPLAFHSLLSLFFSSKLHVSRVCCLTQHADCLLHFLFLPSHVSLQATASSSVSLPLSACHASCSLSSSSKSACLQASKLPPLLAEGKGMPSRQGTSKARASFLSLPVTSCLFKEVSFCLEEASQPAKASCRCRRHAMSFSCFHFHVTVTRAFPAKSSCQMPVSHLLPNPRPSLPAAALCPSPSPPPVRHATAHFHCMPSLPRARQEAAFLT